MPRFRSPLLVLLLTACGSSTAAPVPVTNVGIAPSRTPRVAPALVGGTLAFAPVSEEASSPYLFPVSNDPTILAPLEEGQAGREALAVPSRGPAVQVMAGEPRTVPHGCDGGEVELTPWHPLDENNIARGLVWLVPVPLPAGWAPTPVVIAPGAASVRARSFQVGPLTLALTRTASAHGLLTIHWGESPVLHEVFEKHYMEGAPDDPIDLSDSDIGVPEPVAAWELMPGGPIVLALYQRGYEGMGVETYLVDDERAARLEQLDTELYSCAF